MVAEQGTVLADSFIMMVDDEPIMLDLIQVFLEDAGCEQFMGLSESTQAVEQVTNNQPDVLLLDLVMPEVNGFEVLRSLRNQPETKHLPIVVLTSSSDGPTKLEALELGATDFLAKPVDPSELVLRVRNILTVKAYQDQLAYYDALTGLPNRILCRDRLSAALSAPCADDSRSAILVLRLSGFKRISDSYGSRIGDALLKAASKRLINTLMSIDFLSTENVADVQRLVARIGAEELAVLVHDVGTPENASFIAEQLVNAFERAFQIDTFELFMNISIGISLAKDDGDDADTLLKNASYAADFLAEEGVSHINFYSVEANEDLKERVDLQQDLRKALQTNEEFFLLYQPQVDAQTGVVKGGEALVRWRHPVNGIVPAFLFIPVAEQYGLMVALGEWIFRRACTQAAQWQQEGMKDVSISINVSGKQFSAPNFVDFVAQCLAETQVDPSGIIIELTESLAMDDAAATINLLHELKSLGLQISVDDFGTGYSSLSYLKNFPLDELKIDKAFVDGLPNDKGDQAITSAIITMAKKLSFKVVAEGVEHKEQADYLAQADCDLIQGYYFSKPILPEEFMSFYREHS